MASAPHNIDNGVETMIAKKTDQSAAEPKKKNRRKIRNIDPKLNHTTFSGTIKPVLNETKGTVIRKRSAASKKINIESFSVNKNPFIYTSKVSLVPPDPTSPRTSTNNVAPPPTEKTSARKFNINPKPAVKIIDSPKTSVISNGVNNLKLTGVKPNRESIQAQVAPTMRLNSKTRKQIKEKEKEREKVEESVEDVFENYLSKKEVEMGLLNNKLFKGVLRINPKFFKEAYVSQENKSLPDFFIASVAERNRALEGDVVILKIVPDSEWKSSQKKARVVYIMEKVHPRIAVGFLSVLKDKNRSQTRFQPRDKRIPRMGIVDSSLPEKFYKIPKKYEDVLFMVQILDWEHPNLAVGTILENLGKATDLKCETRAILLENQIDITPFPSKVLNKYLPKNNTITEKEVINREDLRKECVFTIDPFTARDLDDSLSCKKLPNGNFEVGVHIADVSYYLAENTILDRMVCKKATSTYLVDNVYHMLPPELCMHCSLLPGRDNLTFSVIWEMTSTAEIVFTRFTRSIINSCTQLAYEHAQKILDDAHKDLNPNQFPYIYNGYSLRHVCRTIRDLNSLAGMLRESRIKNGALRIDQVKYGFNLDPTGNPTSFFIQEIRDANRMVEEFMLLANTSVAKRILQDFPSLAFLRCHEEPNMRLLNDVKKVLEIVGIHINTSSSIELQKSLTKYKPKDYLAYSRYIALNHLLAKPMTRARYFCVGDQTPDKFHHYALSTPMYTHFTSPIRRYADVMVHRLLSASLGYTEIPNWNIEMVQEIAENCNKQKYNAKKAGEASCDLYMAHYVQENQPCITNAVVVGVQEKSFDVITIRTGIPLRIYANNFDKKIIYNTEMFGDDSKKLTRMNVLFPQTQTQLRIVQVIEIFQIVQVSIKRKEKTNKLEAFLVRPPHTEVPPQES